MSKRKRIFSLIICICVLLTACSEATTEADNNAAAGISGSAISESVVSGSAISGSAVSGSAVSGEMTVSGISVSDTISATVRPEGLPDEWMAKGYMMDVTFRIKERTANGYRATVEIDEFSSHIPGSNWEICLELEDEIIGLSGAEVVSHKGILYTIRGTGKNRDMGIYDDRCRIRFDIAVRCPEGAHEPGICYLTRDDVGVSEKNYKFEVLELQEDGTEVHGTMRFTNCSKKSLEYWEIEIGANFQMKLQDGARIYDEDVHRVERKEELGDADVYDGEYYWAAFYNDFRGGEKIWVYDICGEGEKCSLRKGESVDIPFTGKRVGGKPKVSPEKDVSAGKDTDIHWAGIERKYGAKYGKIDKYLVADAVNGIDLFFVFDEKGKDSYTATAELTNILQKSDIFPEAIDDTRTIDDDWEEIEAERKYEIADWEICLECEDTIEEIEGAEIIAHEGNVYLIRAADKNRWLRRYGLETFRVKVSCEGGIHPLGKVYLVRAQCRGKGISSEDMQKELEINEEDLADATGPRWYTYPDLYGDWKNAYYNSENNLVGYFLSQEEEDAFYRRRKWGIKMGR